MRLLPEAPYTSGNGKDSFDTPMTTVNRSMGFGPNRIYLDFV